MYSIRCPKYVVIAQFAPFTDSKVARIGPIGEVCLHRLGQNAVIEGFWVYLATQSPSLIVRQAAARVGPHSTKTVLHEITGETDTREDGGPAPAEKAVQTKRNCRLQAVHNRKPDPVFWMPAIVVAGSE